MIGSTDYCQSSSLEDDRLEYIPYKKDVIEDQDNDLQQRKTIHKSDQKGDDYTSDEDNEVVVFSCVIGELDTFIESTILLLSVFFVQVIDGPF